MAATFRVKCTTCGEVVLGPEAIDLQWCSHQPASFFRYACPTCGEANTRPADGQIAKILVVAGVKPTYWHLPAEALESHDGPPLTSDDILDFHLLLERDDWFEHLTQQRAA